MDESLLSNDSESPRTAYNRKLISELSELKQLKAERENLIRMNHYYIAQLSKFEVQVSELNAQLKAKEKEINNLRRKLGNEMSEDSMVNLLEDSSIRSKGSVYIMELENKINLLQQENDRLQEYYNYKNECDRLRYELEYSQQLRISYEDKYNELLAKMIDFENDESLIFDENDTIKNLNRKIEMLQKANQDLHNEIKRIRAGEISDKSEDVTEESNNTKYEEKILLLEKENIELKQKVKEMSLREHIKVHIISDDKKPFGSNHLEKPMTGSYSQPSLSQRSSISHSSMTKNTSYSTKRNGGNLSKAQSEIELGSSNRVVSPNRRSTPFSLQLEVPQTPEPDKASPRTIGHYTPKFSPKLTPRHSNIGYSPRPSKLPSKSASKTSSVNHFFPSWLRNRKALYVKPPRMNRKTKKRVESRCDPSKHPNDDKFADAFPEENELE